MKNRDFVQRISEIYKFICDAGEDGRTLTELSRKFRSVSRKEMLGVRVVLSERAMVEELASESEGRHSIRLVAVSEAVEIASNVGQKILRHRLLAHMVDRFDEAAKTNYCPPCGTDISGRAKQVTTYTAAVAQPANRGLGFSIDVWRVCESCAIKIMTGEHRDLIVADSIGAAVIRNAE